MSRFIRRFRHFMRRIFSRNRLPRRHQDLIESGPEQIQFQDSDSVQIQDQQDSDSVQIQDQQDSDSVQIQDQQDSDSAQILDQEDSDPSQEQFQLDWAPVQIPYQPDPDTAPDGGIDSLSSQIASLFFSRLRAPQDSGLYKYDISCNGLQSPNFSDESPTPDASDCSLSTTDSDSDIDEPSNIRDVKRIFSSHLASLRADPGRLDAVRESRTFRLCIQCISYRISVCGYLIYRNISDLEHGAELARLGFVPPLSEDNITLEEKEISDDQVMKAALTELLDQAGDLDLQQDVDNVTRACQLDLEARRLLSLAEDEEHSGRWDQVLRYTARAVNLLAERHESWPSWPDLDKSRQQIMDPVEVYDHEDRDNEAEWLVLLRLLRVSDSLLPPHAADVRKHVNFHSQYLDQEVGLMSRFLAERSGDSYVHAVGKLMTGDDEKFCELGIELLDDFSTRLPTHLFGLRLYRLCWRLGDGDLADSAMRIRFVENPDKQQVTELLNQVLTKLRHNPRQASDRIQLNGELDDVTGDYRLPQLLPDVEESLRDKPWWVDVFRQRNETTQPKSAQLNPPTGASASSAADTRQPSSSFVRECNQAALVMIQEREETAADPRSLNREVARLFINTDSIHDSDTYTISFSYISADIDNPITLKLEDHEQKTNIAAGVPNHCSVLTYHPAQDEWSVRSDMCRISGPLAVEQEGATCVPFVGDCGDGILRDDSLVFKIHKSRSEHALREYTADVRAQSTAAWYVNRFRELTQDRFEVLTMLHSDLVIVYQDSNRDTILELMTREIHARPVGSAVKFDKYTSNTSYINRKVNTEFLEALSHFTHHASEGTVMVTDIQGWVGWDEPRDNIRYTLTDPVIHCPGLYYRFGGTNRELQGIRDFFQHVHPTCNHICESLSLTRPEEYRV